MMMNIVSKKAVVFAYHSIGVRCIQVLLARQMDIALVITHQDNPNETIWFDSVSALCAEHDLPVIQPDHGDIPDLHARIQAIDPDFIFSFYYRYMLPMSLLGLARGGAYNLHGSLLPKYRGRVPVNWAVLHGETETGVTLHEMAEKPDAGAIIAQTAVPILPDDTAFQVFNKLTVAAEQTLWRVVPDLIQGTPPRFSNVLEQGSYFGGRRPEDGRIDWSQSAQNVYNLHRAVAPPYPGAFTELAGHVFTIVTARLARSMPSSVKHLPLGLTISDNRIFGRCGDGQSLVIQDLLMDQRPISTEQLRTLFSSCSPDRILS